MITVKKIKVYHRFDGDIDGFSRCGSPSDISDDEWRWLDDIFMKLHMIMTVPVSQEFVENTQSEILSKVDSDKSARLLDKIAKKKVA